MIVFRFILAIEYFMNNFKNSDEYKQYMDSLTDKIKLFRKDKKISQLALANILDQSSTSFIARIELRKDGHNYSFAHLLMIAKALNIDIKDLIPSSL